MWVDIIIYCGQFVGFEFEEFIDLVFFEVGYGNNVFVVFQYWGYYKVVVYIVQLLILGVVFLEQVEFFYVDDIVQCDYEWYF